jgi:hypothetical protein
VYFDLKDKLKMYIPSENNNMEAKNKPIWFDDWTSDETNPKNLQSIIDQFTEQLIFI